LASFFQEIYLKDVKIPVSKQKLLDDINKWDSFLKWIPKQNHSMSQEEKDYLRSAVDALGSELGDYIIRQRINPKAIIDFINANDIIHHPKIINVVKKPDHRWKRQISGTAFVLFLCLFGFFYIIDTMPKIGI
jgi:hypothetical protein